MQAHTPTRWGYIPLPAALSPVILLLLLVAGTAIFAGTDAVASYSWAILLVSALAGTLTGVILHKKSKTASSPNHPPLLPSLKQGMLRSAKQTLPAVPMLLLIGVVAATWMLSGVVPMLISSGLHLIHPPVFLVTACLVCSFISILTGSSWTTIATIGVAFMGIGQVYGYSSPWIAGAIISGAYFGDKVSPLSDTTVLASSSSGVPLFTHIRYMLITTVPAIILTLVVFTVAGYIHNPEIAGTGSQISEALHRIFHLSPWLLAIPALTVVLILLRIPTFATLAISALAGLAGIFIFQPHLLPQILDPQFLVPDSGFPISQFLVPDSGFPISQSQVSDSGFPISGSLLAAAKIIFSHTRLATGNDALDSLVATSGMAGMLPTVLLVCSAMCFGAMMMGTGFLATITAALTRSLRNRFSAVGATAASGLFLNCATADQYLSIIIGSNMFAHLYANLGLESRLLSRTIEDSVSVTSVLIPWNSCGVAQSSVLGVATLAYLPYCVFNYLSPLMSLLIALTGFRIRSTQCLVHNA